LTLSKAKRYKEAVALAQKVHLDQTNWDLDEEMAFLAESGEWDKATSLVNRNQPTHTEISQPIMRLIVVSSILL